MENCTVRAGFVCSNLEVGSFVEGFSRITKLVLFGTIYYKQNRNDKSNNFQAHFAQE